MNLIVLAAVLIQDAEIVTKTGQKLSGKVEKLTLDSKTIGKVSIDGKEIYAIYLSKFRPPEEEKLKKEVNDLITKLSDEDPQIREDSTQKLRNMGPSILSLIQDYTKHDDAEVRTRINSIISSLKETKERIIDSVGGKNFLINGYIRSLLFDGKELDITNIESIKIKGTHASSSGDMLKFTDGTRLVAKLVNSSLKLKNQGAIEELKISEVSKITLSEKEFEIQTGSKVLKGLLDQDIEFESSIGKFKVHTANLASFIRSTTFSHGEVEGKWKGNIKITVLGHSQEAPIKAQFKQEGDTVTGEILGPLLGSGPTQFKGSLTDDTLEGQFTDETQKEYEMKLNAKINNNKIDGKITTNVKSDIEIQIEINLEKEGD